MNIDALKKYSLLRNLNLGQAEKDYYQNIILFIIYNKFSRELIFKGGTALAKCYGMNRFSEDLDFDLTEEVAVIPAIQEGLDNFNISYALKRINEGASSKKYKIKIQGPLYKNSEKTLCSITLDFSLREKVLMGPKIITIGHHIDVIPVFEVYVMCEEEVFSEKIRAIMTRESARDMYDLTYLIKKGVLAEKEMVEKKLELVALKFEKKKFIENCKSLQKIWGSELGALVKNVPNFRESLGIVEKWASGI